MEVEATWFFEGAVGKAVWGVGHDLISSLKLVLRSLMNTQFKQMKYVFFLVFVKGLTQP